MIDRLSLRLLLAQGADVATFLVFYVAIGPGIHQECNPILVALMAIGGIAAVAIFKLGITVMVVARRRRAAAVQRLWFRRLQVIAISAATASGVVGSGFNIAAIVSSIR